jgi:chitinase
MKRASSSLKLLIRLILSSSIMMLVQAAELQEDSKLLAYVGNWQDCPTRAQWEQYTHIVIGFAVTYQWAPGKNVCSTTCEIDTPPVCENAPNPSLIQEWKAAGKKVLLSFGGAGMGGSWDGLDDCWEYCYGREEQVVSRLVEIAAEMNVDGVDIDYEYYYQNFQAGSNFFRGPDAIAFLEEVTMGLREKLPPGSTVAHVPMDVDLVPETEYYKLLTRLADQDYVDFVMPQYYNGITKPGSDFDGALSHFTSLVEDMFQGDPTKVVFGFCIADCSFTESNLNAAQAVDVIEQLQEVYPCNGGAFFWEAVDDINGSWSTPVRAAIQQNVCSSAPTPPIAPTTPRPTLPPVPPTPAPSRPPIEPSAIEGDHGGLCCPQGVTGFAPANFCQGFVQCDRGIEFTFQECPPGLLFNQNIRSCDWDFNVECRSSCEPGWTDQPSMSPSATPSTTPSASPSMTPTDQPSVSPSMAPSNQPTESSMPTLEEEKEDSSSSFFSVSLGAWAMVCMSMTSLMLLMV